MSKGIISSVMASCLFAVMYFYTSMLAPLDGEEIFGWRTLLTLPCLTLFMLLSKDWKHVGELLARVRRPLACYWAWSARHGCWVSSYGCSSGRRCTGVALRCRWGISCCRWPWS